MPEKLKISVKAASRIMGEDAAALSDQAIEKLIVAYTAIASEYIKTVPKV